MVNKTTILDFITEWDWQGSQLKLYCCIMYSIQIQLCIQSALNEQGRHYEIWFDLSPDVLLTQFSIRLCPLRFSHSLIVV